MKIFKPLSVAVMVMALQFLSYGQNLLTIGGISKTNFNTGSGQNSILIQGVNDNDGYTQNITFTGVSGDSNLFTVVGVSYTQGNKIAIVYINVSQTNVGSTSLVITANDGNGEVAKTFSGINVGAFFPKGCTWSVYDIVFYQNAFPINEKPLISKTVPSVQQVSNASGNDGITFNGVDFRTIGLKVGNDCKTAACGTYKESNFYTIGYKGIIYPTLTGIYIITMDFENVSEVWIGNNVNIPNSRPNTLTGKTAFSSEERISDTVWFNANTPYGFRATSRHIHADVFSLRWDYVGTDPNLVFPISFTGTNNYSFGRTSGETASSIKSSGSVIGGNNLFVSFDQEAPYAPTNLLITRKSSDKIDLKWNSPTNKNAIKVRGYNVYVDDILALKKIGFADTTARLFNLSPSTTYSIVVSAYDDSNNESRASNIVTETTYPIDASAPTVPNVVSVVGKGDMSVEIAWGGAQDPETGIYGYKIYVNGEAFNVDTLNANSVILKTYDPGTALSIEVESYNGSGVKSATKSSPLSVVLDQFSPTSYSPGVKKARLNIEAKYIGRHEGFGINGDWNTLDYYSDESKQLHRELHTKLIRWGTLASNPYRFEDKIGPNALNYKYPNALTVEAQEPYTTGISYAKFANMARELDAFAAIAIGGDSTPPSDWRLNPEQTGRRFIIYLGATLETPGLTDTEKEIVSKRIAEGYTEPILPNLKGLFVEFINEPWGGTSYPYNTFVDHNADFFNNYKRYGTWCRRVARAMKSAPGYDSTKVKLLYSTRRPRPSESFGTTEAMFSKTDSDVVDGISTLGSLNGNYLVYRNLPFSNPDLPQHYSEFEYIAHGWRKLERAVVGLKETMDLDYSITKKQRPYYFYESDFTELSYNQRLGQAVLMTDYFLSSLKYGNMLPTIFSLTGSVYGISSFGNVRYPFFKIASLINRVTYGNMLETTWEGNSTVKDDSKIDIQNFENVSTHVFNQGNKYQIVLVSREFENSVFVKINLPDGISLNPDAKKYVFTGATINATESTIDSTTTTITDGTIVEVPKHSIVVIAAEGNNLGLKDMPLGYTKYKKPTSYVLSDDLNGNDEVSTRSKNAFFPIFTPADARAAKFKWDVVKSDENMVLETIAQGDTIFVSVNNCVESGATYTVTGTLLDDPNLPNITQSKVVNVISSYDLEGNECNPNSVIKTDNSNNFKIYPNPSAGEVTFESVGGGKLLVYNTLGVEIYNYTFPLAFTKQSLSLETGSYIVKFIGTAKTVTKKVIVTR